MGTLRTRAGAALLAIVLAACVGEGRADAGPADHVADLREVSPSGTRLPVRMSVGETMDLRFEPPADVKLRFRVDAPLRLVGRRRAGVQRFRATGRGSGTVRLQSDSCDGPDLGGGRWCAVADHGEVFVQITGG